MAAKKEPFTLIVDTREQLPYDFKSVVKPVLPFDITTATLRTGDYSALGFESSGITIDRKSLADAFHSFGKDRDRFESVIARMAEFDHAAVVIEATWAEIFHAPPKYSLRMKPKTILASAIAWEQRFGVHFHAVPGRAFAEQLTYRMIERFVRDRRGA